MFTSEDAGKRLIGTSSLCLCGHADRPLRPKSKNTRTQKLETKWSLDRLRLERQLRIKQKLEN